MSPNDKFDLTMADVIYRFRAIAKLLGDFKELERETIYFAPPEKLNDPVEGLKNIFWSGDEIVWKNLLRHYLICLDHACTTLEVGGETEVISSDDIAVLLVEDALPEKRKERIQQISKKFFQSSTVSDYPLFLASRSALT